MPNDPQSLSPTDPVINLQEEARKLQERVDALTAENKSLKAKVKEFQSTLTSEVYRYHDLEEKHMAVAAEYDKLKADMAVSKENEDKAHQTHVDAIKKSCGHRI